MSNDEAYLNTTYNRIIKGVFHCVKGTRLGAIYQQVHIFNLHTRMMIETGQYFSQLLRAPKSGILYSVLQQKWWSHEGFGAYDL